MLEMRPVFLTASLIGVWAMTSAAIRTSDGRLLDELLDLRQAIAVSMGRQRYVYRVIDEAVHTGHAPTLRTALSEFAQQPADVKARVLEAIAT